MECNTTVSRGNVLPRYRCLPLPVYALGTLRRPWGFAYNYCCINTPSDVLDTFNHQESDVLIRVFEDHGLVAVINGTPVKKFLKSQFHAKVLKSGATETPLQKLMPPNTYVIVVRAGSTTTSIAKAVVACCRAGGDTVVNFNAKPIAVKVR